MSPFPELSKDTDYNGYVDDDEFLRNVFPDEFLRGSKFISCGCWRVAGKSGSDGLGDECSPNVR